MKDLFLSVLGFNTGLYVFILFCQFNSKLIPTSTMLLYFLTLVLHIKTVTLF